MNANFDNYQWADQARRMLCHDEGVRKFPYKCSQGFTTIGVGRNLSANGVSEEIIKMMLTQDIEEARKGCIHIFGVHFFEHISPMRQLALINLCFNLGAHKLAQFHETIALIKAHKWEEAADRLLTLPYAKQVGDRAKRVGQLMREENFPYP